MLGADLKTCVLLEKVLQGPRLNESDIIGTQN